MTKQANGADWAAQPRPHNMRTPWRLAGWGSLATVALFVAVVTSYSSAGSQRQAAADQGLGRSHAVPGEPSARGSETEETRRLSETVRALAADRDQAFARIAALEHSLDNITGSIQRGPAPANGQPAAALAPPQSAQPSATPLSVVTPMQAQPAAAVTPPPAVRPEALPVQVTVVPQPLPAPALQPVTQPPSLQPVQPAAALQPVAAEAARAPAAEAAHLAAIASNLPHASAETPTTGLGLDIGGAVNYEGLRTLWHSTKNSDPGLADELYPLVAVRENNKTRGIDLRLLVGPIDDMETASHLCAALMAAHHYCQPVAFEGQRLSLNEPPAGKPVPVRHPAPPKPDPTKQPDAKPPDAKPGFFSLTR